MQRVVIIMHIATYQRAKHFGIIILLYPSLFIYVQGIKGKPPDSIRTIQADDIGSC